MSGRYVRLLLAQIHTSVLVAAQYRAEFLIDGFIEVLWSSTALAPLLVIYGHRSSIAGWSFGEALVVLGFFTLLQAVLEGVVQPSFLATVEQLHDGSFDYVLLKPADAEFLASTARFYPWRSINVVTALVMFSVAFSNLGRAPSPSDLGLACLMMGAAVAVLHSLWILILSLAFRSARVEEVTDLFTALFEAARWPASVFRGILRIIFTFVVPLTVMTTVPARALLGLVDGWTVAGAIAGAALLSMVARRVWVRSLIRYTSASS